MRASPQNLARALNAGRVALGASLVFAPRLTARPWLGLDAAREPTTVVARAHGFRDAVLGAIALQAVGSPGAGARHLRTLAVVDLVDIAVTWAGRRSLPRTSVPVIALLAGPAAAAQLWAAARLDMDSEVAGPSA